MNELVFWRSLRTTATSEGLNVGSVESNMLNLRPQGRNKLTYCAKIRSYFRLRDLNLLASTLSSEFSYKFDVKDSPQQYELWSGCRASRV